jgi:hypothetical protein
MIRRDALPVSAIKGLKKTSARWAHIKSTWIMDKRRKPYAPLDDGMHAFSFETRQAELNTLPCAYGLRGQGLRLLYGYSIHRSC